MNAQKLAIAIGLLNESEECMTKIYIPIVEIDGVKNITSNIHFDNQKKDLTFEIIAEFKFLESTDEPDLSLIHI